MRYGDILKSIADQKEDNVDIKLGIIDAIGQIYPMIVLANLTKNSFVMLKNDDFLYRRLTEAGEYDAMIEEGAENIHPSYRQRFLDSFSRTELMHKFADGYREIEAKLYQKSPDGNFQWVLTKVIRIEDESGDLVQICFNRVIGQ